MFKFILCVIIICDQYCEGQEVPPLNLEDYENIDYDDQINSYELSNTDYPLSSSYFLNQDIHNSNLPETLQYSEHQREKNTNNSNFYKIQINEPTTHRPNYSHLLLNSKLTNMNRELLFNDQDKGLQFQSKEFDISTETSTDNVHGEHNYNIKDILPYFSDSISDDIIPTTIDVDLETTTADTNSAINLDGKSIISVVTTKSVINNTVLPVHKYISDNPQESFDSTKNITDNWIVLGSIQTSKSISESRLKESNNDTNFEDEISTIKNIETTFPVMTKSRSKSSTESLIDKLDRVQSDLSSRLLSVGFNNITIIQENTPESGVTKLYENNKQIDLNKLNGNNTKKYVINRTKQESVLGENIFEVNNKTNITKTNIPKRTEILSLKNNGTKKLTSERLFRSSTAMPKIFQSKYKNRLNISQSDYAFLPPKNENGNTTKSDDISPILSQPTLKSKIPASENPKENISKESKSDRIITPNYKLTIPNDTDNAATNISSSRVSLKPKQIRLKTIIQESQIDDISAFLPPGYRLTTMQSIVPASSTITAALTTITTPSTITSTESKHSKIDKILKQSDPDEIDAFLPPGYKVTTKKHSVETNIKLKEPYLDDILKKSQPNDISALLSPGFKFTTANPLSPIKKDLQNENLLNKSHSPKISKFLPSGNSSTKESIQTKDINLENILSKTHQDEISAFLPPGYKVRTVKPSTFTKSIQNNILTSTAPTKDINLENILSKTHQDEISAFLPPGYKIRTYKPSTSTESIKNIIVTSTAPTKDINLENILSKTHQDEISAFLPPGYKIRTYKPSTSTESTQNNIVTSTSPTKDINLENILSKTHQDEISAFLPPGYKARTFKPSTSTESTKNNVVTSTTPVVTTKTQAPFKVVFPSRPNKSRKTSRTSTTVRSHSEIRSVTPPTIHIGWPSRVTKEFTGWPTPSTTPISIEKLLESAKILTSSTTEKELMSTTLATTTTTTTTTTSRTTTPGVCENNCDLASTIKLIEGAKWVPELLDRNTNEWQILSNEIKLQLEDVYSKSKILNRYLNKVRIDGFSKGSVLVDYVIELKNVEEKINTIEIKRLFHDTLQQYSIRNGKSINPETEGILSLGKFVLDPKYTDFIVIPSQPYITVENNEEKFALPQWTIAAIVIGLASLLFIIIFGVTVLVNREKNSKKKTTSRISQDMLNELDKNHMGGLENYAVNESVYDLEWIDDQDIPNKEFHRDRKHFDSWKSEWNGYYFNAYYGKNTPMSSQEKALSQLDSHF